MAARPPAARSLWPREHGAYVQLLVPLLTALIATRGSAAGAAIAIGACLAFLASEPLRVVLGAVSTPEALMQTRVLTTGAGHAVRLFEDQAGWVPHYRS